MVSVWLMSGLVFEVLGEEDQGKGPRGLAEAPVGGGGEEGKGRDASGGLLRSSDGCMTAFSVFS